MIDIITLEEYTVARKKGEVITFPNSRGVDGVYSHYLYDGKYYSFARLWHDDELLIFTDVGLVSDDPNILHEAEDIEDPDEMKVLLRKHKLELI